MQWLRARPAAPRPRVSGVRDADAGSRGLRAVPRAPAAVERAREERPWCLCLRARPQGPDSSGCRRRDEHGRVARGARANAQARRRGARRELGRRANAAARRGLNRRPMVAIVLVQPEIPPNTGNVIRLAANTGAELHLVEPLGFRLDDRELKRAGLDYHEYTRLSVHRDWTACRAAVDPGHARRWYALTTKGQRSFF